MIPNIEYFCPESLQEIAVMMHNFGEEARILAGGTDIIPALRHKSARFARVKKLIDIKNIPALHRIKEEKNSLRIGSAVTFTEIVENSLINERFPLLAQAASRIGSVQIRNRATIGGNLVNNAPCADSAPPLLVYNAEITVLSPNGVKKVPLSDFLSSPYRTQLSNGEIVTEIEIPFLDDDYRGEFYKLGRRRAVAISRISLAILAKIERAKVQDLRIASGAVTPIAKRFFDLEKEALGKKLDKSFSKKLAQELGRQVLEITGLRYSTAYKLPVVQQLFYQLLRKISEE